ncbi:MAG: sulfate ABC transporter substrate-binding protein [Thermoleophilaceae bacterium]|nr:sulfate ABC transporter substrate-binding protein [Thermoleophilaceae bacterium]
MSRTLKLIFSSIIAVVAAAAVAGCGSGSDSASKLALVAYSTPQEAYSKLIPAFQATSEGKGVTFSQSYGASGDQSRAVANGLAADVVEFSFEPDITRLVEAGKVSKDWSDNATNGIVTDSVVVFAVRKGNPKNIKTWDDLVKPGVDVITANPVVSGGARWNLVAAYGQALKSGDSPEEALAYVKSLLGNVSVQDKSGRESLQTFVGGKGDVLLTYENEAKTAQAKGQDIDYVIPPTTLLIENPIAVTSTTKDAAKANAFVDYLKSDAGQKIWAEAGYRPVDQDTWKQYGFPQPETLITVGELGGWTKLNKQLFDEDEGEVTKINEELGVSNDK